ncbi:MAG: alginate lyase family protein [Anaerolineales bacterium]
MGPRWLAYRLGYAWRRRTGGLRRRLPALPWDDLPFPDFLSDAGLADPAAYLEYRRFQAPTFFFNVRDRQRYRELLPAWDGKQSSPLVLSDEIGRGKFRLFGHHAADLGLPPDWHVNPLTGDRAPVDRHWSQIDDFGFGDIKVIWETSRFGAAYALVRAYWRSGDEQHTERFWNLVEDWREKNPPQLGVNWKCGQEASFRVMAWCFGLYGFLDSPATTPERVHKLAQMIAVTAERIEANLSYALSQNNNHGISESLGLWTIGALFPEFRQARKWQERGAAILEDLGVRLIYEDGAFAQSSANYHRLALQDYLWCLRLGEIQGAWFSDGLRQRVESAFRFMQQIQIGEHGQVPNYGQDDGSLILPLNNCDQQDFRPIIQAMSYLLTGNRCYEDGPWDEDLLWLFGPQALSAPVVAAPDRPLLAEAGGCYGLFSKQSYAFIRCASFRHRPSHADMLHVDLWWRGENVAIDAGTFAYQEPPPWNNPLAGTRHHNTVTVDGLDQMDRAGRFLWLPWLTGTVQANQQSAGGHLSYWQGEHDGYQRLRPPAFHQRGVLHLGSETWLVLDRLWGGAKRTYVLHWLFPDIPHDWDPSVAHVALHTAKGDYHVCMGAIGARPAYSLVSGDQQSPRGWRATCYRSRKPALSLQASLRAPRVSFWTLLGPSACDLRVVDSEIRVSAQTWEAEVQLLPADEGRIVGRVSMSGSHSDRLDVIS